MALGKDVFDKIRALIASGNEKMGTSEATLSGVVYGLIDGYGGGGGGGFTPAIEKDVNFYDYDGTCVYSYTKEEFLQLSSMPTQPDHSEAKWHDCDASLVSTGWNWTYEEAVEYLQHRRYLYIGATYTTPHNETRMFVDIDDNIKDVILRVQVPNGQSFTIDWGDGTHDTQNGTGNVSPHNHSYATGGYYCISISATSSEQSLYGNTDATSRGFLAFSSSNETRNFRVLNSIKIMHIGPKMGLNTYALSFIFSLKAMMVSSGVRNNPKFTNIDLYNCGLEYVVFPRGVSIVGAGKASVNNLTLKVISTAPNTAVLAPKLFAAYGLNADVISSSSSYKEAYSVREVMITKDITAINDYIFYYCMSLEKVVFMSPTPPTLIYSETFQYIPTGCIFEIPAGSLAAYTSATNYPATTKVQYVERSE